MEWWIWIVLGLVLLLGELVTPGGFYILFFGVGAIFVGILAGFNIAGPVWFQVIVFSGFSLITLWLFANGWCNQLTETVRMKSTRWSERRQ